MLTLAGVTPCGVAAAPGVSLTVQPPAVLLVPTRAATRLSRPAHLVPQPAPPVSARDFRMEPKWRAPEDNDNLIPNPATPTGSAIAPPSSCSILFSSSRGATSTTVNRWIALRENTIRARTVLCLSGVFRNPLHIWSKTTPALLEVAPAPGRRATFDLGKVSAADTNPNQYWSDSGGISVVDSRSVEIYGLRIENYSYDGPAHTPAGIYVTTRSDTQDTKQGVLPHLSACFLHGGACSDIYIIHNTVTDIANTADENHTTRSLCDNANVDAYGIAVIAGGTARSEQLQHVVVEDNIVSDTRTGESETMTFNGALKDFLVAGNIVDDADNIGIDTIGWETGGAQASHGYVDDNTVYNIDTLSNASYGSWNARTKHCSPLPENAAGLYDDGASYIWFGYNRVWNSDQGINLDVETAGKETDHLLVSHNIVHDDPGTSPLDPSSGTNPPGAAGRSTVAGHDVYALYIDAFGPKASISDVYVHDNVFQNESQYYLNRSSGMPVVDLGGLWSNVEIWHNVIDGLGRYDRYNPLIEVDAFPEPGSASVIDCNDYGDLSSATNTVDGNFAVPSSSFMSLAAWQKGNTRGWDLNSKVGGFASSCPTRSVP